MALTEEQLLTWLESGPVPCAELLEELDALYSDGKQARALEWAELSKEAFIDRKLTGEIISIYEWIVVRRELSAGFAEKELMRIFAGSRKEQKFIGPAFRKASSAEEAFLRLRHLRAMKKGMLCYNKTWGFGVIRRIDPFYQKVEVEFEKKGDHEMAFSYAAEALDVLTEDHLLAIRHNAPDEFIRLMQDDPAEVIRITLRSYGPLSVNAIQDHFVPDLLPTEAGWKKFWDQARKDLKNDPLVEIPARRTVPLRLRRKAKAYDEVWFKKLKAETDVPSVFQKLEEILAQNLPALEPYMKEAVADRLAFAVRGGALNQPRWIAGALILAEQLGVEPEGTDPAVELKRLSERADFSALLEDLPARSIQALLHRLFAGPDDAKQTLLQCLPELGTTALNGTIDALILNGAEDALAEKTGESVRRRTCSPALLFWIWRNRKKAAEWGISDLASLAFQTVETIEKKHTGTALRAQNQLREQLEDRGVLESVLAAMNDSQRRDFMRRITESPAWSRLDRKSLQAKIIKLRPDLHEVVLKKSSFGVPEKKQRVTSKRTYQARKNQFERILKKEIPENSKEIELARSYGDLRENAEYKFAKEKQRLLSLQAEELQKGLDSVKPTDFKEFPCETAGLATGVELLYEDGRRETYYILGEWDQDEALHIISCEAGMAQALKGAKAGDRIDVPTASGDPAKAEIAAVSPLPAHILEWISGEPS